MKLTQEMAAKSAGASTVGNVKLIRPGDAMATELNGKTIGQIFKESPDMLIGGDSVDSCMLTFDYPGLKPFDKPGFKFRNWSVQAGKKARALLLAGDPAVFQCRFVLGKVSADTPGVDPKAIGKPYFTISAPGNGLSVTEKVDAAATAAAPAAIAEQVD